MKFARTVIGTLSLTLAALNIVSGFPEGTTYITILLFTVELILFGACSTEKERREQSGMIYREIGALGFTLAFALFSFLALVLLHHPLS